MQNDAIPEGAAIRNKDVRMEDTLFADVNVVTDLCPGAYLRPVAYDRVFANASPRPQKNIGADLSGVTHNGRRMDLAGPRFWWVEHRGDPGKGKLWICDPYKRCPRVPFKSKGHYKAGGTGNNFDINGLNKGYLTRHGSFQRSDPPDLDIAATGQITEQKIRNFLSFHF
jgi:hypothetical protein